MTLTDSLKNFFYSEKVFIGFIIAFGLAMVLESTGIYLLMLVAGGIAGFFVKKGWLSFIIGFVSVALAWGLYFVFFAFIGPLGEFFALLEVIIGISGMILMVMALIFAGLMGGVAALVGAYLTQLILGEKYLKSSSKQ